ncbi:uncharacterized protein Z519_04884 [Cladophialophora bantiana CBS 173.52]|uniref:Heterokaryon incompatibility domain-containing protein n=1 Tax=Cladophialophora bantiana (strain ATCC 10958 / CBS 173.52 / CDC B-1940 / NIH 8579) TaxID=1442370 RepID=A0A0D2HVJ4_CLAB1|nr:uncharacterized protein Z519_04884 [Cladophialophora bantiana CBS 173.52]KIW94905.1 hypothetical protein Z519_04884 [Cladophialophora bantiana CBS 173.52]
MKDEVNDPRMPESPWTNNYIFVSTSCLIGGSLFGLVSLEHGGILMKQGYKALLPTVAEGIVGDLKRRPFAMFWTSKHAYTYWVEYRELHDCSFKQNLEFLFVFNGPCLKCEALRVQVTRTRSESLARDTARNWVEDCHFRSRVNMYTFRMLPEFLGFTAISYIWGNVNDTRTVAVINSESLGGQSQLRITANLHHALCQVQKFGTPVWADGICISQNAESGAFLREKEQQVEMMGQIYSGAL